MSTATSFKEVGLSPETISLNTLATPGINGDTERSKEQ